MRNITEDDIHGILEMGHLMHQEGRFSQFDFNDEKVENLIKLLINNGIAIITEGGFFLGLVTEHFFGNDKISLDLALYVREGFRGEGIADQLIDEYIKVAREMGAVDIGIGNSMGNVGGLYERHGFSKVGGVYRLS